jgi:hypothetical protein
MTLHEIIDSGDYLPPENKTFVEHMIDSQKDSKDAEILRLRSLLKEAKDGINGMLIIFDREGTAPRENGLSIGARECDRGRALMEKLKGEGIE